MRPLTLLECPQHTMCETWVAVECGESPYARSHEQCRYCLLRCFYPLFQVSGTCRFEVVCSRCATSCDDNEVLIDKTYLPDASVVPVCRMVSICDRVQREGKGRLLFFCFSKACIRSCRPFLYGSAAGQRIHKLEDDQRRAFNQEFTSKRLWYPLVLNKAHFSCFGRSPETPVFVTLSCNLPGESIGADELKESSSTKGTPSHMPD